MTGPGLSFGGDSTLGTYATSARPGIVTAFLGLAGLLSVLPVHAAAMKNTFARKSPIDRKLDGHGGIVCLMYFCLPFWGGVLKAAWATYSEKWQAAAVYLLWALLAAFLDDCFYREQHDATLREYFEQRGLEGEQTDPETGF